MRLLISYSKVMTLMVFVAGHSACVVHEINDDVQIKTNHQRDAPLDDLYKVIFDPTNRCPLHRVDLSTDIVRSFGGMSLDYGFGYDSAMKKLFPYSRWAPQTHTCLDGGWGEILVKLCRICRRVETRWRESRGWQTDPMSDPPWGKR